MGEHVDQVSLHGANLQGNAQAFKLLEAFVNYPADILTKAISGVYEEFAKKFDMDKFPIEPSEKHNQVNQMRPMQEILIAIQIRCVTANDEMYNLIVQNAQQRPSDLNEVRNLELMLRAQIQIYELVKFESPGKLKIAVLVSGSLISLLDERAKNKILLTL